MALLSLWLLTQQHVLRLTCLYIFTQSKVDIASIGVRETQKRITRSGRLRTVDVQVSYFLILIFIMTVVFGRVHPLFVTICYFEILAYSFYELFKGGFIGGGLFEGFGLFLM